MIARALPLAAMTLALPLTGAASDPLAGRVAGPPQNCITLRAGNGPTIVDRTTILYRDGGRLWKATPIGACTMSMEPISTVVVEVYGGQLCQNDRFRILSPGMSIPSPFCRFGPFTPYVKVKK